MRWHATAGARWRGIGSAASVDASRTRPPWPWTSGSMAEPSRARLAKARTEAKVRFSRGLPGRSWALACLMQADRRPMSSQAGRRQDAASAGQSEGIQDAVLLGLVYLASLQRRVGTFPCRGRGHKQAPWQGEEPTDAGAAGAGHPRSWRLFLSRHPQRGASVRESGGGAEVKTVRIPSEKRRARQARQARQAIQGDAAA